MKLGSFLMDYETQRKSDEATTYQLTLLASSRLYKLRLPSTVDGQFFMSVDGEALISVYAEDGKWIGSGLAATMYDHSNNPMDTVELNDGDCWYVFHNKDRQILMVEACTVENLCYERYLFADGQNITIGRKKDCGIRFTSPFVSKEHAILSFREGVFRVEDLDSANGVFVNGVRVKSSDLALGDVVSILTLNIIIGAGFLAVNSRKLNVDVSSRCLELFVPTASCAMSLETDVVPGVNSSLYNRLPRRRLPQRCRDINIEMPPFPLSESGIPLMLRMGGSAAHGAASVFTGNPIMLLSTILFPFLSEKFTEKQRKEYEERRVAAYTRYLQEKAREIATEKRAEEAALQGNYPAMNNVLNYPRERVKLWERRKTDDDFLTIRIGSGQLPLKAKVNYPEERFSLERDDLEEQMYALAQQNVMLEHVPIMIDFVKHHVCGVKGPETLGIELVRRLITRIATLHSYDEVKIVLIVHPDILEQLGDAKYLPHLWDDEMSVRFIVTNANEAFIVGEHIAKTIANDADRPRSLNDILKERAYFFVLSLDKQLQDCMEILKTCSQLDENCGMTLLSIFDDIPKDCSLQISLVDSGIHSVVNLRDIEQDDQTFIFDPIDYTANKLSLRAISNTVLKTVGEAYVLPKAISFLEMFSVGNIAHLNVLSRWEKSNPVATLAAPVGVDTSGNLFQLDLHQKYQGPHGLVAGMTGSGKSEFLLTYILTMAINYRPDEVSFVLIDYKGGGLAGAFEDRERGVVLPHLAGTITNLDGSAIQRSLISLQSEVVRRQTAFNDAKSLLGESTIDIYSYQRYYREGRLKEPISHLFIISDEFAELKDQKPEFLDHLISIARIGRSLGVHLILATQKPSGVVNDQILSNTKFRVCFKVQTRNDSVDMLKRPEAAELQDTGRFYLQVGYNELFALGQSAWSGAPYIPQDEAQINEDSSIRLIDNAGQDVLAVKKRAKKSAARGSQLTAIVEALSTLAKENSVVARQLWVPSLEKEIDIDDLPALTSAKGDLSVNLGMADDPERQSQYPLTIDLAKCNNVLVVGSSGSGKTALVQSVLLQICENKTASEVNVYILDYSSRLLGTLRSLPHCGAVLTDSDESYIDAFFALLDDLVEERKLLYASLGVDSFDAARRKTAIPLVLVVIDNFSGLGATKKGEAYAYGMADYLKRGSRYGIKYLVTCSHVNEVNMRARQEMDERITLHAKDRYEYEEVLGVRTSYLPPDYPGRGLCVVDGRPLELQVAILGAKLDDDGKAALLHSRIENIGPKVDGDLPARKLPVIDEDVTYPAFCERFGNGMFPLGFHLENAKAVGLPMRQFTGLSIYFGSEASKLPVLGNLLHFANRERMRILMVEKSAGSRFGNLESANIDASSVAHFSASDQDMERFIRMVAAELQVRQQNWDSHKVELSARSETCDAFEYMRQTTVPWLIIFEGFGDICALTEEFTGTLGQILPLLRDFNMYPVGCFYPDDKYGLANNPLVSALNKDDLVMLFGGYYAEQKCTDLPMDYARVVAEGAFNRFLMKYRGKFYSALMPCEEIEIVAANPEEMSIFD